MHIFTRTFITPFDQIGSVVPCCPILLTLSKNMIFNDFLCFSTIFTDFLKDSPGFSMILHRKFQRLSWFFIDLSLFFNIVLVMFSLSINFSCFLILHLVYRKKIIKKTGRRESRRLHRFPSMCRSEAS